jgi:hypothetical protein
LRSYRARLARVGVSVVDRLGDWDENPATVGWVEFNVGPVPSSGSYKVTVHYMFWQEATDANRRMTLTINGVAGETRQVNRATVCCATSVFDVTLTAGTNTIRISHAFRQAPAIDKIVISSA